jgi:hypothetical protein
MAKASAPKKGPGPKIPRVLKEIIAKSTPQEPPPAKIGRGIAGASLEAGQGQSALLSIDNDGPAKQISMAAPFGRPTPEMQAAPLPLLQAEEAEEETLIPAGSFDEAWQKIASEQPEEPTQGDEGDHEEENPFGEEEASETPEEPPQPEGAEEVQEESNLIEEMVELRKTNQRLREELNVVSSKNGAAQALNALKAVEEREKQALGTIQGLRHQLLSRPNGEPANVSNNALPLWKGKDLRVLCPFHKITNPATAFCLLALALDFGRDSIGFLPALGDARIANSRDRLADDFLKTGAQWALMIDDDMIPTLGRPDFIRNFIGATPEEVPDAVLAVHVVKRLMESAGKLNAKLIGATYFGRRKYSPAMFKEGIDNPGAYDKAKKVSGDVLATEWVATGCMLIHRDVFLGIQRACPELAPTPTCPTWNFFQEGRGQDEGEDVMFCRRAKQAGFQAYVDTGAQCFHVGYCAYGFHNTTNRIITNRTGSQERDWWK